jgi:hypothetical protein
VFGPTRRYQAPTVLRGLLAQFGRHGFDQGKLCAQTGVYAFSDRYGRRRREGVGPNLLCEAVDLAFEVKKLTGLA